MFKILKHFTDRGLSEDNIKININSKMENGKYFKQPKDSLMFKALYGHHKRNGDFYINTRNQQYHNMMLV